MNNPYFIDEPAAISFSGGRSSGHMFYNILEAHGGTLPDYVKVIFANTGKEMLHTLDFVRDCGEKWGVDIVWVEGYMRLGGEGENKYCYETRVVDYESAARNGEPFRSLILRPYLPNPVARFCTQELKILRIRDYMTDIFPDIGNQKSWLNIIGIRGDEPRRFAKSNTKNNYMPMYHAGVAKADVGDFWRAQDFDLQLPNNNGVTDWGNCDLCYLKGLSKKLSIIRERPDLADWWIETEEMASKACGKPVTFRADQPSYADMKIIATDQPMLLEFEDDETIPCYCGD